MGVSRDQIHEGARCYWKLEASTPGAEAELRLMPAEVLELHRGAARIKLLESGKEATVRFSHLEADLEYLATLEEQKAKTSDEKRKARIAARAKPANTIVTSRFIRPGPNGNTQDLAAAIAEGDSLPLSTPPSRDLYDLQVQPVLPHLTVVPRFVEAPGRPPVSTPEPAPSKPTGDDFDALDSMSEMLLDQAEQWLAECGAERVELMVKRREVEIALEENAKRQKTLEVNRTRIQQFLKSRG